jgi:hypothetical protein
MFDLTKSKGEVWRCAWKVGCDRAKVVIDVRTPEKRALASSLKELAIAHNSSRISLRLVMTATAQIDSLGHEKDMRSLRITSRGVLMVYGIDKCCDLRSSPWRARSHAVTGREKLV